MSLLTSAVSIGRQARDADTVGLLWSLAPLIFCIAEMVLRQPVAAGLHLNLQNAREHESIGQQLRATEVAVRSPALLARGVNFTEVRCARRFTGLSWLFMGVANSDAKLYDDELQVRHC